MCFVPVMPSIFLSSAGKSKSFSQRRNSWILICWNLEQNYCTWVIRIIAPIHTPRYLILNMVKTNLYVCIMYLLLVA